MTDTDNTQPQDDDAQQRYDALAANRFAAATAIRRATEEAEAAAACEKETAADLTTEQAAHEEHRRGMALLLDLPADADWLAVTRVVTEHRQDRDRLTAEVQRQVDAKMGVGGEWGNALADLQAERTAHETHRRCLGDTLGVGAHADWAAINQRASELADTHEARRLVLSEALGLGTGADWDAITERAADITTRAAQTAELLEAAEHAGNTAEAERVRLATQVDELTVLIGEYAERATTAEAAALADARHADKAERRADDAERRRRTAEAALTRVRAECAAIGTDRCNAVTRILAAIGDDQPAEARPEPERCAVCGGRFVIQQTVTTARLCGDCGLCRCGETPCLRIGINGPAVSSEAAAAAVREHPAEPLLRGTPPEVHVHVSVTPAQVKAAVRQIIREDRATLRDVTR